MRRVAPLLALLIIIFFPVGMVAHVCVLPSLGSPADGGHEHGTGASHHDDDDGALPHAGSCEAIASSTSGAGAPSAGIAAIAVGEPLALHAIRVPGAAGLATHLPGRAAWLKAPPLYLRHSSLLI